MTLALDLLLLLSLQAPAALELEAPLRNDTLQPASAEAQARLLEGDRAWERHLQQGEDRDRTLALEAWFAALEEATADTNVRATDGEGLAARLFGDPDRTLARRSEHVAVAVERRLKALAASERAMWGERFGPLGAAALARAGSSPQELARVELRFPRTSAGARAALRLADLALEAGDTTAARTWLGRAELASAGLAGKSSQSWELALTSRGRALDRIAPPWSPPAPGHAAAGAPSAASGRQSGPSWRSAAALELLWSDTLTGNGRPLRGVPEGALGRRVESGVAFLDDGTFVVQCGIALVRVLPDGGDQTGGEGQLAVARFPMGGLVEDSYVPYASSSSGGWPLLPATDGESLYVVAGRARAGGGQGNGLLRVSFPAPGAPLVHWRLGPETHLPAPGGDEGNLALALGREGSWEFQPGPVVLGDRVLALARRVDRSEEAGRIVLFALDRRNGRALWSREVTRAADLREDLAGLRSFGGKTPTPGQPLGLVPPSPGQGARVFVGSNVGLGNLYDVVDGRLLYSLRCRRRLPEREGWPGSRRPWVVEAGSGRHQLTWPAFDSDFLYFLAEKGSGQIFERPPLPIGSALGLISADSVGLVAQVRDGLRSAIAGYSRGGSQEISIALDRGERFAGTGLASRERVLFSSDRHLYLLDRERQNALLGSWPLELPRKPGTGPFGGAALGGGVYARDDQVVVVGSDTVWLFRVTR